MKKGDIVTVLDENLDGTVISVQGTKVVFRDKHGFTHRYESKQLLIRDNDLYRNLNLERQPEPQQPSIPKKQKKDALVLDLHFQKLVTDTATYDSFERLFIQQKTLLETLDFCRENKLKKLKIIHGIGDGTLQKMVYDTLRNKGDLLFDDHDFFYHQSGYVMVEFL